MRYPTPEIRDAFHKSGTMIQVICQVLENYFFQFGHQLDVISVEESPERTKIILACEAMDGEDEANREAARAINAQFKRKDGFPTCLCLNPTKSEFEIYVTHSADLAHLN